MGKLTKSMAIFNSYFDITRGLSLGFPHDLPFFNTYGGHKSFMAFGKNTYRPSKYPPKNMVKVGTLLGVERGKTW